MTEVMDTARGILKTELDTLIELVKDKDRELYDQYRAVRGIKDLGGSHRRSADSAETASKEVDIAA